MTTISIGLLGEVNYWAVLVTGIVSFFLGGLWYSPVLFETAWMQANGYDAEQVRQIQSSLGALGFGITLISYLCVAWVFALLVTALGVNSVIGGLTIGILLWFGFVATTGLAVNLFSDRPIGAWLIDSGFQLLFLTLSGIVLASWR